MTEKMVEIKLRCITSANPPEAGTEVKKLGEPRGHRVWRERKKRFKGNKISEKEQRGVPEGGEGGSENVFWSREKENARQVA